MNEYRNWGVWDRVNECWVDFDKTEAEAKFDADRWNVVYSTPYYVARQVGPKLTPLVSA